LVLIIIISYFWNKIDKKYAKLLRKFQTKLLTSPAQVVLVYKFVAHQTIANNSNLATTYEILKISI